jgi:Ser/Thr protein kinase RdoA (MazF antagonist)
VTRLVPPPPDRALPALGVALNAPDMLEIVGSRLGEGVIVRACDPCYVRYKPATNCIVQYRLELEDADSGRVRDTIAHAKLFAGGRAERVWSRGSVHELAATAGTDAVRAAHLPELDAVLQLYPVDLALPALAFVASPAGRHVFEQLVAEENGARQPELLRYKPARKALLRFGSVYAKLYAHEKGRLIQRAGGTLRAAGVPTAAAFAYLPSLRLLAHEEALGRPLRALRGGPAFERGVRAAGAALARLHAAEPVRGLPRHGWAQEGATLTASASAVGVLCPGLAAEAAGVAERIVQALADLPPSLRTLHGDFYDDQVLVAGDAAVLIDLDGIRLGHPLLDVGNFLAHLSVRDEHDAARDAFLDGYGRAAEEHAHLLEAAGLLRLAVGPFRRLEPGWPDEVERRLRLAARRLDEQPRAPARPSAHRLDPALPQLAVLRDPALVGDVLGKVFGQPVQVTDMAIVRHKASRRCTLRYDVLVGGRRRAERLFAKTFASERGPRVYRSVSAIAAARACGDAALPEPVAYVRPLKLLLQRAVPGVPVRAALLAGDRDLAVAIAEVVAALHRSGVALDRRHGLADELAVLRARVERVARDGPRARRCLARIQAAALTPLEWRLRPVHRDFYHDQLLAHDGRLAVLDLDDAAMSEPAVDVANFLAHLRLLALEDPARADAVHAAARAFRERCHALDGALDPSLVLLLESATLLRLACIHERLAPGLLDGAEALIPAPVAQREARRRRRTRLDLALDADAVMTVVADVVEERAGARPHGCRAVLLRAKKRRAVVRYELETDRGPVAIVGKWFHDQRAARVAGMLSTLRDRGFAGGGYAVPAPLLELPELGVLFTDAAAGPSLRAVLEASPGEAWRAGAWLARFHTCGATLARRRTPARLASAVLRWGSRHAPLAPHADRLAAAVRAARDPALPVHFDYASADVLVPEHGPTVVVDFDDAGMGDPAFDVANFEATLTLRGWRRAGSPDAFAAARGAFEAGYAEQAPLPTPSPAVEAAVWMRLADRGLSRGVAEAVWRFALERSTDSLARERLG